MDEHRVCRQGDPRRSWLQHSWTSPEALAATPKRSETNLEQLCTTCCIRCTRRPRAVQSSSCLKDGRHDQNTNAQPQPLPHRKLTCGGYVPSKSHACDKIGTVDRETILGMGVDLRLRNVCSNNDGPGRRILGRWPHVHCKGGTRTRVAIAKRHSQTTHGKKSATCTYMRLHLQRHLHTCLPPFQPRNMRIRCCRPRMGWVDPFYKGGFPNA